MKFQKIKNLKGILFGGLAVTAVGLSLAAAAPAQAAGPVFPSTPVNAKKVCTIKAKDGSLFTGQLNDKGQCIYDNTGSTQLGDKPGDPGVIYCGDTNKNPIVMSIDIGCKHKGNAILDALFAVVRFLTVGVSFVIIASMIVASIQFTASRGDPQATAGSLKRMASNASALLLFIFIYAILNWLVPNTLLH
jgi:hypothetical protein